MNAIATLAMLLIVQGSAQPDAPVSEPSKSTVAERDYSTEPVPIIVTGRKAGEDAKLVVVGSRIPHKPLVSRSSVATNTGLHGLTPGSGMDPMGAYTRKLRWSECRASDEAISEEAACLLIASEKEFAEGGREEGIGLLRSLALSENFSSHERLEGAKRLYAIGEQSGDDALRVHALELMAGNEALPVADRAAALRTIVGISMRKNDREKVVAALLRLQVENLARAQDLANLAVLQRAAGDQRARETMRSAIAKVLAEGSTVPQGWDAFIRPDN